MFGGGFSSSGLQLSRVSGKLLSISQGEVTEVVKKLLEIKAPGVDQIRSEILEALDIIGLSWLTSLFSVACR